MGGMSLIVVHVMDNIHPWIDTILEASILIILVIEFIYDKRLNEHVKIRKKHARRAFEYEQWNQGEHK